ncbi:MAG: PAS domain-containing protein [Parvibaculum sp.]|uniref:PAS domain-containing protein n=1 Tax=Parvibaculum sp. TaxID=2024848 RepID=UPI00271570D5|nr:PAS domain-containing protein [Parvibaculum sp.]MDO8839357.1 PAS domain-containing protein [Parvibaculum sp.]MDP1628460.1 PAS domain-containing protein [Parvibaculum sp.]
MDWAGTEKCADGDMRWQRLMAETAPSAGRATDAPIFGPAALADLHAYWSTLPRSGGAPADAAFDPLEIAQWTPDMTIMCLLGPDDIRFRLAGTRVAERMAHDPTGTNILDLLADASRLQVCRDMHEIAFRPCGYHARYMNVYGSGRVSHVQSLYLPLQPPPGQPPRLIAVHAPEEALEYQQSAERSVCATSIDEIVWIDTGSGTP